MTERAVNASHPRTRRDVLSQGDSSPSVRVGGVEGIVSRNLTFHGAFAPGPTAAVRREAIRETIRSVYVDPHHTGGVR